MPQYFDSTPCPGATLDDLSSDHIRRFTTIARSRGFPLAPDAAPNAVLNELRLLSQDRPTTAAILLFGHDPQQCFPSARIQCAQYEGARAQQTCQGTLFQMLDEAMYFVLSHLDDQNPHQLPTEAVREALANAVAHCDYTSNQTVEIQLYSDRLDIHNPGTLPPDLTPDQLSRPHGSYPPNPLLAEALYLAYYRASKATGTTDIIQLCRKAGLPQPQFQIEDGFTVTLPRLPMPPEAGDQTSPAIEPRLLPLLRLLAKAPLGTADILKGLKMKDRNHLRQHYLDPALDAGLIELTIPDKPNSRLQKYRLTANGETLL
ncbi:MAG: hypothetical protein NTY77_04055 [Elusimicrobia bacterium]|nr:hypothetical protein [Elusimicrobiota bacterium]